MKYLKEKRVIKGSIQEKRLLCGNLGCHCHKKGGKGHGPYAYLAIVANGKTKPFLLKKGGIAVAKRYVQRYKKLREEIEKATEKNVKLLQQGRLA